MRPWFLHVNVFRESGDTSYVRFSSFPRFLCFDIFLIFSIYLIFFFFYFKLIRLLKENGKVNRNYFFSKKKDQCRNQIYI